MRIETIALHRDEQIAGTAVAAVGRHARRTRRRRRLITTAPGISAAASRSVNIVIRHLRVLRGACGKREARVILIGKARLLALDFLRWLVALCRPAGPRLRGGRADRLKDRARRGLRYGGLSSACASCRPRSASMIACGSSLRGLSLVTTTWSASFSAIAPICGRLPGRGRRRSRTRTTSWPPRALRNRAQRVAGFFPARPACARSRSRRAARRSATAAETLHASRAPVRASRSASSAASSGTPVCEQRAEHRRAGCSR